MKRSNKPDALLRPTDVVREGVSCYSLLESCYEGGIRTPGSPLPWIGIGVLPANLTDGFLQVRRKVFLSRIIPSIGPYQKKLKLSTKRTMNLPPLTKTGKTFPFLSSSPLFPRLHLAVILKFQFVRTCGKSQLCSASPCCSRLTSDAFQSPRTLFLRTRFGRF